jgi:2-hydroxychromene-2-carboxylate isomerase
MTAVEFYFDCSCPWSYLAFTRLQETAKRTGATIVWKPILVDRVRHAADADCAPSRCDPVAAKEAYRQKDRADWAHYCGIAITTPPGWPADTALAMAGCVVAAERGRATQYVSAVYQAYFGEGRNIGDETVLVRLAESAGIDREVFLSALRSEAALEQVHRHCDELVERGGFGSPTMFVGDDMYFGNDRMPLVEFAIGQSSGRAFVMPGQHGA